MRFLNLQTRPAPAPTPDLDNIERRLIRIETKLSKLLTHFGLTADGKMPLTPQSFKDHHK